MIDKLLISKLLDWIETELNTIQKYHNTNVYEWDKGYRKALREMRRIILNEIINK